MENNIQQTSNIEGIVAVDYDLEKDTGINYLFDYTKYLIKNNQIDEKILFWQVENSAILKPLGLDYKKLKEKLDQKNKKYYQYDNLIEQIEYRFHKHGRLAPTKDIAKRYDPKEIDRFNEQKEGDLQNPNEMNYYDLNDSWINDDEVGSDHSDNEFFKISLAYGNYTEEEVVRNINRNKKHKSGLKKDPKIKKASDGDSTGVTTISREQQENRKRKNGDIDQPFGGNSREEKEKIEKEAVDNDNGNKVADSNISILPINITFFDEGIDNIIKESMVNNEIPKDPKDVLNLLKKLVVHYKKIREDETKTSTFLNKLSELVSMSLADVKLFFEFEFNKLKREGIFSNVSKLINKFVVNLTENNIRVIINKATFLANAEIKDKLNVLLGKVAGYIDCVQSVCDFLNQEDFDERIEKIFAGGKTGKMSIKDGKDKIVKKLKENLEKNKLNYDERVLLSIMNVLIDPTENTEYFEIFVFEDINKDLEPNNHNSSIVDLSDEPPQEEKKPPTKPKNPRPAGGDKTKHKRKLEREEKKDSEKSDYKNSVSVGPKKPILSKRFYVKQYDEKDFSSNE